MGFLSSLLGIGVGKAADGIASAIDKFVETPEEKKAAEIILMKAQQQPAKWQAEINKMEAGHRTVFVAGWRPFVGWVAALALAWGWIVGPILVFLYPGREMPAIEVGQAISLIMAMLGMGALRTYEKREGISG